MFCKCLRISLVQAFTVDRYMTGITRENINIMYAY